MMKKGFMDMKEAEVTHGTGLIADPVYHYIVMTDRIEGEGTERGAIDTPWVQRLRRIFQLQSARWVFPAAEHTRFQHSLGTMHVAGTFSEQIYPSLFKIFKTDLPSFPYVQELLRLAGLLHDVGHGPFCHFLMSNIFLDFIPIMRGWGSRSSGKKWLPWSKGFGVVPRVCLGKERPWILSRLPF